MITLIMKQHAERRRVRRLAKRKTLKKVPIMKRVRAITKRYQKDPCKKQSS